MLHTCHVMCLNDNAFNDTAEPFSEFPRRRSSMLHITSMLFYITRMICSVTCISLYVMQHVMMDVRCSVCYFTCYVTCSLEFIGKLIGSYPAPQYPSIY